MADLSYMLDYKIKQTIDNKINPYLKMLREKLREIDNNSVSSVLEVDKMLNDFLQEYNQFRAEVAIYVANLGDTNEKLNALTDRVNSIVEDIVGINKTISTIQTELSNFKDNYNEHLKKKYYHISFNENGGSDIEDFGMLEGQAITEPKTTKDEFKFLGWYLDADFNNSVDFPLTIDKNYSLYAKWRELEEYLIVFEENGGLEIDDLTVLEDVEIKLPETTKEYYDFKYWCSDIDLTQRVNDYFTPTSDITLYAKYTPTPYTVYFEENGGIAINDLTGNIETPVELPTPVYTGYEFKGWYSDDTFQNEITSPYTPTSDITLYARWIEEGSETGIGKDVRYIKWSLGGSTGRAYNVFTELMAFDTELNNIALGKPVMRSWDLDNWVTNSYATDGVITNLNGTSTTGCEVNAGTQEDYIIVDLQTTYKLLKIATFGDYKNSLTHNINKLEISTDMTDWETIYDASINGVHQELQSARVYNVVPEVQVEKDPEARYIRWTIGNDVGRNQQFNELTALSVDGGVYTNIALNKPVWYSWNPGWITGSKINNQVSTDYVTYSNSNLNEPTVYVIVDLESIQSIKNISHWGYSSSSFTNTINKIEISKDLQNWSTYFDATVDGAYKETTAGHTVEIMPDTQVNLNNQARYIRWTIGDNNKNRRHIFTEIQAFDETGTNVALGKNVFGSFNAANGWYENTYVTDGNSSNLGGTGGNSVKCELAVQNPVYIIVDLESVYTLTQIIHWGDYVNSLTNNINKIELSQDLQNWDTVFNATVDGTYVEAKAGHTITL